MGVQPTPRLRDLRRAVSLLAAGVVIVFAGAACSSGSDDVPSNAIAVVGNQTVTKADFNRLLDQSRENSKSSKRPFPKSGTAEFAQIRHQIVQYLVRRAQLEAEANKRGIEISDEEVDQRRNQFVQQYFEGNEKAYAKRLKASGVTDEQARADLRSSLIQEKFFADVIREVKVSDAELQRFYRRNKAKYAKPARRDVRQILLRKEQRALAGSLVAQLRGGADFARLAHRYSVDQGSKENGGRVQISRGQVEALDTVAFSIATHRISEPVRTRYGWHVIEALGPVEAARTPPFKEVKAAVREELMQRKRIEANSKFVERVARSNDVKYGAGFAPAA